MVKRWLATLAEPNHHLLLRRWSPRSSRSSTTACHAVMSSVINEAEPFETAAAASVRERMVTACNVPAAAAPVLGTQTAWTAWTAWSCLARRRRHRLPKPVKRFGRNTELETEKSFLHQTFIGSCAVAVRMNQ